MSNSFVDAGNLDERLEILALQEVILNFSISQTNVQVN